MDSAITLIGYALAVLLMLMTGLGAEIDKIRAGFSTARRRLTLRVIAVNLLLIPLIAIAFVRWAQPQGGIWAGIVLLALCPAAPMAPPLVTAANGDTSWAVALTVPLVLFGTLLLLVYLPLTGSLWQSHSATSEELSTLRLLLTMLPRRIITALNRALVGKTLFALEEQLFALTAALSALRIEIPCHGGISLNATLFRRAAAIVRHWRHIRNAGYFETHGVQRAHCRLAARAGALDAYFKIFDATLNGKLAALLGGDLRGKGRGFTRALKTVTARRCPSQGVALPIGDGHDGVVE